MKADVVVWIGCVLIFMAGVLWSPIVVNTRFSEFGYETFKTFLECVSYVATMIAAWFAVLALNAWKAQFNHSERFKALSELSDAAIGLSIIGGYIYSFAASRMYNRISKSGVGAKKDDSDIYHEEWRGAFCNVRTVLDKASIFLGDNEYLKLKSRLLEMEESQKKRRLDFYKQLESFGENQNDIMDDFVHSWISEMNGYVDGLKDDIRDFRKDALR